MTEQQACALCGAGGHAAAQCPWNAPGVLESIRLPKHGTTFALDEVLSNYLPHDREDVREAIEAYADIQARKAVMLFSGAGLAGQPFQAPELPMQATDGGRNPLYEDLFEGETEEQRHNRIVGALRRQVSVLALGAEQAIEQRDTAQAKVAELEKQEPVHWRALLDPNETPQQLNRHMHIVGFVTQRAAEDWIAAQRDFDGWHYSLQPLYAAPVAQAGQVPEAYTMLQALVTGDTGRWILSKLDGGQGAELGDGKNWLAARELVRAAPAQGGRNE